MHCEDCGPTHCLVKVHVVGDDVDVGMEDVVLSDHLLQDVSHTGRKDQQRNLVLGQMFKKHLVAVPEEMYMYRLIHILSGEAGSMAFKLCVPEHSVRFFNGPCEHVLPDFLLNQQVMNFGPPVVSRTAKNSRLYLLIKCPEINSSMKMYHFFFFLHTGDLKQDQICGSPFYHERQLLLSTPACINLYGIVGVQQLLHLQ